MELTRWAKKYPFLLKKMWFGQWGFKGNPSEWWEDVDIHISSKMLCYNKNLKPWKIKNATLNNIKSISRWSTLKNVTGVRRFLGLLCYYEIFVKGLSNVEYHLSWGKSYNFTISVITLKTMGPLVFKILKFICWYSLKSKNKWTKSQL